MGVAEDEIIDRECGLLCRRDMSIVFCSHHRLTCDSPSHPSLSGRLGTQAR
jgi:hypothetical protein